jgi:hypothetical protein
VTVKAAGILLSRFSCQALYSSGDIDNRDSSDSLDRAAATPRAMITSVLEKLGYSSSSFPRAMITSVLEKLDEL